MIYCLKAVFKLIFSVWCSETNFLNSVVSRFSASFEKFPSSKSLCKYAVSTHLFTTIFQRVFE